MNSTEPFRNRLIDKIETKEDALTIISICSYGFYAFAVFHLIMDFLRGTSIIPVIVYSALGFFLKKYHSRTAAVIFVILTSFSTILSLLSIFLGGSGGRNFILPAIAVWIGVRAVQATFFFHRITLLKKCDANIVDQALDAGSEKTPPNAGPLGNSPHLRTVGSTSAEAGKNITEKGTPNEKRTWVHSIYWFYREEDKQIGPVAERKMLELLDQGKIGPETLVWNETLTGWMKASDVDYFQSKFHPS